MKPIYGVIISTITLIILAFQSQHKNQEHKTAPGETRHRQVRVTLRSGEIVTGLLVKSDGNSINLDVKNTLQSVPLQDVTNISFDAEVVSAPTPTTTTVSPSATPFSLRDPNSWPPTLILLITNIAAGIYLLYKHFESKRLRREIHAITSGDPAKQPKQQITTIIGVIVKYKSRQSVYAYLIMAGGLLLYYVISLIQSSPIPLGVYVFVAALFIISFARQFVLKYRVKKGFYGNNEYEVREIIKFILDHSDDTSFTGGRRLTELEISPAADGQSVHDVIWGKAPGHQEG